VSHKIFALFTLLACAPRPDERLGKDTTDTRRTDTGVDTGDECVPETEVFNGQDDDCDGCVDDMSFSMYFSPMYLVIRVYGGDPGGYRLGFICTDGIMAEACLDGVEACHALTTSSGTDQTAALDYVYSEDEVVPSTTTMLSSESICSYAFWDSSGACNVFYPDSEPNHYAETDCCPRPFITNPF